MVINIILLFINILSFLLIFLLELLRDVLFNADVIAMVHSFICCDVHFLNKNAVSRDTVSLLNMNDVTNNKILNSDGLSRSEGTSVNDDHFLVFLILQTQELLVFTMITNCCNQIGNKDTKENG